MPAAYLSGGTRASAAAVTTITPNLAAGSRGAVYAIVSSFNNAVHNSATAGWTKKGQWNSGAGFTVSLWYADRAAVAAGPTVTWAGAANAGAITYVFDDPLNRLLPDPGTVVANTGTGATHSSASFAATAADSLAIYFDAAAANTALATPAGWTEHADVGGTTDGGRNVVGSKALTNAGDASGAISVAGANAAWVQIQIELRTVANSGLEVSKLEAGAWLSPDDGLSVTKLEAGAWLSPNDGLSIASLEPGVWLRPLPSGQATATGSFAVSGAIIGRRRRRRAIAGAFAFGDFIQAAGRRAARVNGSLLLSGAIQAGARRPGRASGSIAIAGAVRGAGEGSGLTGNLAAEIILTPALAADLTLPILLYAELAAAPSLGASLFTFTSLAAGLRARPRITARLSGFTPRGPDAPGETIIRAQAGELLDHLLWRTRGSLDAGDVERTLGANPGLAALGPALPEGWPVVLPPLSAPSALPPERELIQLWDA